MKTWHALAVLLVLGGMPAHADDADNVANLRGEIELSELERDVEKGLLREAMVASMHARMQRAIKASDSDEARKKSQLENAALDEFIQATKTTLVKRTIELEKKKSELLAATKAAEMETARKSAAMVAASRRSAQQSQSQPLKPSDDKERQGLIEKMEDAQVELQVLQRQSQLYQDTLSKAVEALATAEFAASLDETQREKAEAERKRFDNIKKKHVEFSKKMQLEQENVVELRKRLGMGGGFQ